MRRILLSLFILCLLYSFAQAIPPSPPSAAGSGTGDMAADGSVPFTGVVETVGVKVRNGATSSGFVDFYEDSSNGTSYFRLYGPEAMADNYFMQLPPTSGATGGQLYFSSANKLAVAAAGTNGYLWIMGATIPGWAAVPTWNQSTTGNATTATGLANDGANCATGSYPLGVDASGNAESCTAISYPTAATLHLDDILTALGIASQAVVMPNGTGSTIPDASTQAAINQALETAVEARATSASMATDNATASHAIYKDGDGHIENQILAIDAHAASTTITLIPGICPVIHNASQAAADINNALPALAEGLCFVMQVRTAQAANYWRLTAATGNTVCLDGTCDKDYVSFAAPAVANKVSCIAMGTTYWDCETIRGTATTD